MDYGMNFDSTLLFPGLRMAAHFLEKEVGEQCDGSRIDDLKPFQPFWSLAAPAVRGKRMAVSDVSIAVYGLEYSFGTSFISISECAAAYLECDA